MGTTPALKSDMDHHSQAVPQGVDSSPSGLLAVSLRLTVDTEAGGAAQIQRSTDASQAVTFGDFSPIHDPVPGGPGSKVKVL